MKIIGITGASGSGKSEFVNALNLPVINADKVAREVVEKGSDCLAKLVEHFGEDILFADGTLNRKLLAKKAFSTREQTDVLNSITHPFIKDLINKEICDLKTRGEKVIVLDAPQLFEANCEDLCDFVVGVLADFEIRKARIMKRDNINEDDAVVRLGAGKSDDFFYEKCDKIIINNDSVDKLKLSAKNLLKELDI